MSRIGKFLETESRLVIARGGVKGRENSLGEGENVLESDSSDGYTIL